MFRNYLRIAFRNLLKNKVYSFINIFGLAIGMTAFLLIIHYVRFERSYESFHKNADNIYRVTLQFYNGSEYVVTDCETQTPLGAYLKDKMPEVVDFVKMKQNSNAIVRVSDQKFFEERIYIADPSALSIFSLDVLNGDRRTALNNPFQVVISESMAKKYFGRVDVANESIEMMGDPYKITAVIADIPPNTHLKFDFLISYSTIQKIWPDSDLNSWKGNNDYTYLLMSPGIDLANFNEKLKLIAIGLKEKIGDNRFIAECVKDIHLYSHNKTFEPEANGNARTVYFLLIVAIFIIVIAWVNYINLSTARAVERAREVGVRKVMGSARAQLILQFLSESVMVNIMAAVLALILVLLSLPFFRDMAGQPLQLNILGDKVFWMVFSGLFLLGAFLSGLYPAFVLSSFEPATVLKGKFRTSAHGQWLRKGLVIVQFSSTMILLVSIGIVYLQINFLQNYDLGMRTDHILVLRPNLTYDSVYLKNFQSLRNKLLQYPAFQKMTRSEALPGLDLHEMMTTNGIFRLGQERKEKGPRYYIYGFDEEFIPTFRMTLLAGRNFGTNRLADRDNVLINERALQTLGFRNPEEAIGAKLTFRTRTPRQPSTIIGVLKNFHQRSPKEEHLPMIFKDEDIASFFSLRIKTDQIQETIAILRSAWGEISPGTPFHYFFLDEKYNQQYKADTQFRQVIGTFSGLAVFIACLGLFGLSSFTIVQRTKEIGVRKVLGASVSQIVQLLAQDFVKLVLVAAIVAMPVAYLAMEDWLSHYALRINLNAWVFASSLVLIILITLITVSFQTIKAALANPVNSLKYE